MARQQQPRSHTLIESAVGAAFIVALTTSCTGGDTETESGSGPSSADSGSPRAGAPVQLEEDGLPADFPRDEVPLVDGDVVSVSVPDKKEQSFTILLNAGESVPGEVVGDAVSQLEQAGWTARTELGDVPPAPQVLVQDGSAAQRVIITNSVQDATTLVTYSVLVAD